MVSDNIYGKALAAAIKVGSHEKALVIFEEAKEKNMLPPDVYKDYEFFIENKKSVLLARNL